jgi:hypothetical protein
VGVGAARDDIEEAARFGMAISSVTEGGGLVDAPGRGLVGAKAKHPHCRLYPPPVESDVGFGPG